MKVDDEVEMIAGPHKGKCGIITYVVPRKADRAKTNEHPYYFHVLIDDQKIIQTVRTRMKLMLKRGA